MVQSAQGRDDIHRGMDRLERWAHVQQCKVQGTVKCKDLDPGNSKHKYRLGREQIKSSAEERGQGLLVDKFNMNQQHVLQPRKPATTLTGQKQHGQQVKGDNSAPLPALVRHHLEYCIQLRSP